MEYKITLKTLKTTLHYNYDEKPFSIYYLEHSKFYILKVQ